MIRSHIWMLDVLSHTVDVQVAGLILCVSFKGFTFHDNLMLSKGIKVSEQIGMVKYVSIMGFRLTGAFIFDQPSVFSWLWSMIRMFVSETIRSRMNMCGSNYDKIKAVLPDTSILPVCMGGAGRTALTCGWMNKSPKRRRRRRGRGEAAGTEMRPMAELCCMHGAEFARRIRMEKDPMTGCD
mmetsp:Transcript_18780/g.38150  ORF Transcript_18780/g.38150 Transcript_18780/m.38150 type:complete len:182 (+) Transcript_18780:2-547(+)